MRSHFVVRLTVALLILFMQMVSASAETQRIVFKNFSIEVALEAVNGETLLYKMASGLKVRLAHRVIIKTIPDVEQTKLQETFSFLKQVTLYYKAQNFAYYLAELDSKIDMQEALVRLEKDPLVLLVQPDLLQLADKESHQADEHQDAHHDASDYIEKLKIPDQWKLSKGKGIHIAIIDDGFDLKHEDLKEAQLAFAYDVETRTLDPSPRYPADRHGTQIAGIIFAQHNDIGIDGIAPEAELIAIRHADTWTSRTLLSFYLAKIAKADVVNCSWTSPSLMQPVAEVIQDLATTGRKGLGSIMIFAAGNKRRSISKNENEAGLPDVIAVGAIDNNEQRLKLSNYGPMVNVFTYGQRIRTTSWGNEYSLLTGTSAAAAIVSGMTALLLSANNAIELSELKSKLSSILSTEQSQINLYERKRK